RISGDGVSFGLPHRLGDRMRSLVSWSRLFIDQEVMVAVNTDETQSVTAYSTVAPTFRVEGDRFQRIFWYAPGAVSWSGEHAMTAGDHAATAPPPSSLTVERRNG